MVQNSSLFNLLFSFISSALFLFATANSSAQERSLLHTGQKVLFVGNESVGAEGGLGKYFRRTVEGTTPSVKIETDWIPMYDKATLDEMYVDTLVNRIKTANDSLLIVSSGSDKAMRRFAQLIKDAGKQVIFFELWANNPLVDPKGMTGFKEQTEADAERLKRFEEESGIPVVPCGLIFYDLTVDPIPFWNLREDYLYTPGRSVQNDLGMLANISAIYAVTTGKSPVGLPFWEPFSEKPVQAVQARVWEIVKDWQAGKIEIKPIPDKYTDPKWPALVKNNDHILYICNSYIGAEGGLNNHFERMAAEMNPPLTVNSRAMIHWGRGLKYMYNDSTLNAIKTEKNDLVVVTGGPNDVLKKFKEKIDQAGSKMMVHFTWALNPTLRENNALAEYQEEITEMVAEIQAFEKETGVPVAPCGLVFYDLVVDPPAVPGLRLDWTYMVADIHQNHIGTMANAAVHYAVMTGRSPVGLRMWDPYPPELVKAVQERAWQIVQDWKTGKVVIKPVSERRRFNSRNERQRRNVKWVNPDIKEMDGLSHHVLQSKALDREVGYTVWTPAEYDRKTTKRYPALYFLHGMGGNESADAAGFSEVVAKAIKNGDLPPVICILPDTKHDLGAYYAKSGAQLLNFIGKHLKLNVHL
jgi:hypothetical protein